jgi:hypothetical protein
MKLFALFTMIAILPLAAPVAHAKKDETALERYYRKRMKPETGGPCKVINNSCLQAGFVKDGSAGRDLKRDCRNQILKGRPVRRVSIHPGVLEACRLQKESEE